MFDGRSLDSLNLPQAASVLRTLDASLKALRERSIRVHNRHCFEGRMHILCSNFRCAHAALHRLTLVAVDCGEEIKRRGLGLDCETFSIWPQRSVFNLRKVAHFLLCLLV